MSHQSGRLRRILLFGLKLVVSFGLLAMLFRQTDVSAVTTRLRQVQPAWVALALLAHALLLVISGWRWRRLLLTQDVHASVTALTGSCLVATFFNNFLPSNIGGDVIRIADTAPLTGSRTVATAVVLLDRALGLIALFAVAAAGSLLLRQPTLPGLGYLWLLLGAGVLIAMGVLARPRLIPRLLSPLRRLREDWVERRLDRVGTMLERVASRRIALIEAFAGAIVVQLLVVCFYLAVAYAIQIDLPFRDALIIVPISLVIQLAPVSINGLGVREAVFSYFFARLGHGVDAGLALSLAGAALIIVASLPGGLLFLLRRGLMMTPASSDTP
jgi:glycosyltransferase 2 family protein